MQLLVRARALSAAILGDPERDRLESTIKRLRIVLHREMSLAGDGQAAEWSSDAILYLKEAEEQFSQRNWEQSWQAALAAERATLLDPRNTAALRCAAVTLSHEIHKLSGWRAKSISELLSAVDAQHDEIAAPHVPVVLEAIRLRDDYTQNRWYKIALLRWHLCLLSGAIVVTITLFLALSWFGILPAPFSDARQVGLVVLFGMLGALTSVAQSMLKGDLSAQIPEQRFASFAIVTRPGVGAAAALVTYAMLQADALANILQVPTKTPEALAVAAFIAGFSERFLTGAVERITQSSSDGRSSGR